MKAVIINPPKEHQVWAGVPDIFNGKDIYLFPPLGIMYLSSAIREYSDHEVKLLDAQPFDWSAERVADEAVKENPDFVGVSTQTHNLVDVKRVVRRVRERMPDVHICLGGAHCWNYPEKAIAWSEVNSVVRGDGEQALPQWLDALEKGEGLDQVAGIYWKDEKGKVHENEKREPRKDLDDLPFPDRDSLPRKYYYTPGMKAARTTTMITSRGCPYRCNYCDTYKRYSVRSAKSIVDEMQHCQEKYGIEEIHFIDDLFNRTSERVIEIAREVLNRGLKMRWGFKATCRQTTPQMLDIAKKAGCTKIHYGVETGTNQGLISLNKKLTIEEAKEVFDMTRRAGIISIAYMLLGTPHEKTPEDVFESMRFIRKLDPDYVVWALLSPYPDTQLFKKGIELGLYEPDCWDKFMEEPQENYNLPTVWEEHMSKETLVKLFKKVHRDFYFNPSKIFRTVFRITTMEELKRIIRGGISLIRMEFLKEKATRRL